MRTAIWIPLALALAAVGVATPAAAACSQPVEQLSVCDFDNDGVPDSAFVRYRSGVAAASAWTYDYENWGNRMIGAGVAAETLRTGPLGYSWTGVNVGCQDYGADGSCDYTFVVTGVAAGGESASVVAWESGGTAYVCTWGVPGNACTPLP